MLGVHAATVVEQGHHIQAVLALCDFTHKDGVIALGVLAAIAADKNSCCPIQQGNTVLAGLPCHFGKAVDAAGGKPLRQGLLVCTQYMDGVMRASLHDGQRSRTVGQTPEHQRGIQRHRVEGADRHP